MPAREPPWEGEDELVADLVQLGVTRTKAYGALHQLVEKGMLRRQPGRVARFEAADPRLVARQLRQRGVEDQAMLVADTGALVADLFDRYYAAPASGDPFDFVELIRNGEAARARREAIVAGATAEVLLAHQAAEAPVGDPPSPREGVRHRSVYELGALDAPGFRERVAGREARGEELRFAERVAVGPGTWLVLEHPGLSTTLGDAFDLAWARARRA